MGNREAGWGSPQLSRQGGPDSRSRVLYYFSLGCSCSFFSFLPIHSLSSLLYFFTSFWHLALTQALLCFLLCHRTCGVLCCNFSSLISPPILYQLKCVKMSSPLMAPFLFCSVIMLLWICSCRNTSSFHFISMEISCIHFPLQKGMFTLIKLLLLQYAQ